MPAKKKTIKLIVFDVDGTLLTDDQNISDRTIEILKTLQHRGMSISLATGKIYPSVEELMKLLQITDPVVLSNGAVIQKPGGEVIDETSLPEGVIQIILDGYRAYEADLALFTPNQIFVEEETFNTDHIKCIFKEKIDVIGDWRNVEDTFPEVCKAIMINRYSQEMIDKLILYLEKNLDGKVTFSTGAPNSIEVMPFGVSKQTGLIHLVEHLQISMDEVMVFGDHINDFGMLEIAGVAVAVGNAIDEVKQISDFVIGTNNQEGPADFLSEYFQLKL